jgi:hypothetical protein
VPLDWLTMTIAFNDNQLTRPPTPQDIEPLADRLRAVNATLEALLNSTGAQG